MDLSGACRFLPCALLLALVSGCAPTPEPVIDAYGLVAVPQDASGAPLDPVRLDGSGSADPDGDTLSYHWTQVAGPVVELQDASSATPHFLPPAPGKYVFELVVSDGISRSEPARVNVEVTRRNRQPVARTQQTLHAERGTRVLLDGRASFDPDGDRLTYRWRQADGPETELAKPETAVAAFDASEEAVYAFELVVSDGNLDSEALRVEVHVGGRNSAPTAVVQSDQHLEVPFGAAAPERLGNTHPVLRVRPGLIVRPGELAVLDAGDSYDPDGDDLVTHWKQLSGPAWIRELRPMGEDGGMERVGFVPTQEGTYTWRVWVSDNLADSADAVLRVEVRDENRVPVAHAGNDLQVFAGEDIRLDGRASSDPDDDKLLYRWKQVEGPHVRLSGAATARPWFLPREPGTYVFRLRVADSDCWSAPDLVQVRVLRPNMPPTVAADPARVSVKAGTPVVLQARGHDPEGEPLRCRWSQKTGADLELSPEACVGGTLRVTPRANGVYVFRVVAHDGKDESLPAYAKIEVTGGARGGAPIPAAPEQMNAMVGHPVELDASASRDPDGDRVRFTWKQIAGAPAELQSPHAPVCRVVPPAIGEYRFAVTVRDGDFRSLPHEVTVVARGHNMPPTAAAETRHGVQPTALLKAPPESH